MKAWNPIHNPIPCAARPAKSFQRNGLASDVDDAACEPEKYPDEQHDAGKAEFFADDGQQENRCGLPAASAVFPRCRPIRRQTSRHGLPRSAHGRAGSPCPGHARRSRDQGRQKYVRAGTARAAMMGANTRTRMNSRSGKTCVRSRRPKTGCPWPPRRSQEKRPCLVRPAAERPPPPWPAPWAPPPGRTVRYLPCVRFFLDVHFAPDVVGSVQDGG